MTDLIYKRIMVKISGEALMGQRKYGLDPPTVERIANEIKQIHELGAEVCMVIGGGNVFRGLQGSAQGMDRTTADYMGMLATVINALAMQASLEASGVPTRVLSAIPMDQICEPYIRRRAMRHAWVTAPLPPGRPSSPRRYSASSPAWSRSLSRRSWRVCGLVRHPRMIAAFHSPLGPSRSSLAAMHASRMLTVVSRCWPSTTRMVLATPAARSLSRVRRVPP